MRKLRTPISLALVVVSLLVFAVPASATNGSYQNIPYTSPKDSCSAKHALIDVWANTSWAMSSDASFTVKMYARRNSQSGFTLVDTRTLVIKAGATSGKVIVDYNITNTIHSQNKDYIKEIYFTISSNGETYFGGIWGNWTTRYS